MIKAEIVQETIDYYQGHSERFSYADSPKSQCVYLNDRGQTCAFGRCLSIEAKEKISINMDMNQDSIVGLIARLRGNLDSQGNVRSVSDSVEGLDDYLKPQYRGHRIEFWEALQSLHDDFFSEEEHYWDKETTQLSEFGKEKVSFICSIQEVKENEEI